MKRKNFFPIIFSVFVLLFASLACTMNVGGPDYPEPRIPVTEQGVTLEEIVQQAIAGGLLDGRITIVLSEQQLTTILHNRLETTPDSFFFDPQVYLRDGQMQVFGSVRQGYFTASVGLTLSATVDVEGKPALAITSVVLGPLPTSEGINQALTALVEEAFTGVLGPVALGFRLESIVIADGNMTLTGRIR